MDYQSRVSEASEALVAEGADLCGWYIMISVMPGPIYIRLPGIVVGRWVIVLGQKKFKILKVRLFFIPGKKNFSVLVPEPYMISACFEDCRFATHLLN